MHIRLSEACALRARRGMSMETDEHELFTAGCDPDGVVEECGGGWYPGSSTPGYKMGMLRIPQICCTPKGCRGKQFTPAGIQNTYAYLKNAHPDGCGGKRFEKRRIKTDSGRMRFLCGACLIPCGPPYKLWAASGRISIAVDPVVYFSELVRGRDFR